MTTEGFKRKLTAVFSADVAGYSRLMGEDETATVKTLEEYKGVMFSLIKQHRGRVVDSPGDNLLAEFESVVDAVQCAVAVQKELQARNESLPESRKMKFRIGINLGDVIIEQDRLYGDGVNIAARLEALADPGGICVSKTAFDHLESKLPLGYEFLGEQEVKNIAKPVGAYKVLMETRVLGARVKKTTTRMPFWRRKAILVAGIVVILLIISGLICNFYLRPPSIEQASKEKMAFELPDKPSIAVLPFTNMSGDPELEYFSDGITEEIITALSKTPKLLVIARNSSFTYKGKAVKVQKVAEELGVRYVLEGSVRKSENRVRITAQLIDATNGNHLWAERYDRELKDIFEVQDDITLQINKALQVKLTKGEQARMRARGTDNLEAYLKASKGLEYLFRFNKDDNLKAREIAEEVIALDPSYAYGYSLLGHTYIMDVKRGWTKYPRESLEKAFELGQKAIALDDGQETAHRLLGMVYFNRGQLDKAMAAFKKAVAVAPNSFFARASLGGVLLRMGKSEEAIEVLKRALGMNPFPPSFFFFYLGRAYFNTGKYEEAIGSFKKCLKESPNFLPVPIRANLAAAYSLAGKDEEARTVAREILNINPRFTVEGFVQKSRTIKLGQKDLLIDGLRKAGLK